ncbi:LOW QUALITY PROTEIN: glycosyltransferase family 92 protein At1g27200 [Quercus suber]|uniref:LOW QUALITY PROTEIN: glycosyltransferase family 92 protein At1g27200 n=1 Tax=Quercus suber TaxID=58331 RepID=UPI0032DE9F09
MFSLKRSFQSTENPNFCLTHLPIFLYKSNPNSDTPTTALYFNLQEKMRRRVRTAFLFVLLFTLVSVYLARNSITKKHVLNSTSDLRTRSKDPGFPNLAIRDDRERLDGQLRTRRVSSIGNSVATVSILFPDWEVFVIVSPEAALPSQDSGDAEYKCLFENGAKSPANFSGVLEFTNRTTFKCVLPNRLRSRRPFIQPVLVRSSETAVSPENKQVSAELIRWTTIAYESFSTENDVVLFVKGINRQLASKPPREFNCVFGDDGEKNTAVRTAVTSSNQEVFRCHHPKLTAAVTSERIKILRSSETAVSPENKQVSAELIRWTTIAYESFSTENDVVLFVKGINRQLASKPPREFNCVFGDDGEKNTAVRTAVTSSNQEVFRCHHPKLTAAVTSERIKISLEIVPKNTVVPSVAYYTPRRRTLASQEPRSLLCACTMVYNVAKFLREWVMYHSRIGVEKFILYDNGSEDELAEVVDELNHEGFNVTTLFWIWPKTQEAGFSHAALYANQSCTWMMYVDVDEFVFSPTWQSRSSSKLLTSLLPISHRSIGQLQIRCNEFGPSNQTSHPVEGVTQGYTCRRKVDERHKSIVLLDAVDSSLENAIHHFEVRKSFFRSKLVSMEDAVVNHYKYQAWSEFRTKFRRRVSAYVVDWTRAVNPTSKDRTPGLGFEPIKPNGWAEKFCEVRDDRLKLLTQKWFGSNTSQGYKMAWQR